VTQAGKPGSGRSQRKGGAVGAQNLGKACTSQDVEKGSGNTLERGTSLWKVTVNP